MAVRPTSRPQPPSRSTAPARLGFRSVAIGDQQNIVARLRAVLPAGWFPAVSSTGASSSPILDGILNGIGALGAWAYSLWAYVKAQMRIATATDGWLDIISWDFFGPALPRNYLETDASFRARIQANVLAPAGTRYALAKVLTALTGVAPVIIETWRGLDCGAWSKLGGWSLMGAWSNNTPGQIFIRVFRSYSAPGWL